MKIISDSFLTKRRSLVLQGNDASKKNWITCLILIIISFFLKETFCKSMIFYRE